MEQEASSQDINVTSPIKSTRYRRLVSVVAENSQTSVSLPKTLVEEVFENAKAKFPFELTEDARKIGFAVATTSLQDVQNVVSASMIKYESQRKDSKVRK